MATPKVAVMTSNEVTQDKTKLAATVSSLAKGVWHDFVLTNKATAGKAAKFGAGVVVGGAVANEFEAYTPLQWILKGFGPLPYEFTKSGAIQVFEFTTMAACAARCQSCSCEVRPRHHSLRRGCGGRIHNQSGAPGTHERRYWGHYQRDRKRRGLEAPLYTPLRHRYVALSRLRSCTVGALMFAIVMPSL
jgi:hypothetical protein